MCCSCLLEIYMVWEILSVITDVHHQAGLLLAYTKVLQMQDDADTVDIILRRGGGGHQGVVSFGLEHGWTKA